MQILKIDRGNNSFEAIPDSFDDLWHLEKIIEPGDSVSGEAERKIKPRVEGDKPFREKIFVELEVEKAVFHEASGQLRIQGVVVAARPEELVPLKSHHTIEAEPGKKILVKKKSLKNFHVERLERAKKAAGREKVLLVVMDDEEAELAFLKDTGMEAKARILSGKEGKRFRKEGNGKTRANPYFEEILSKIIELKPRKTVVAGPGFEKQNFEKFAEEKKLGIEFVFESTNSTGISGMNELIKSGKIDKMIEGMHSGEEEKAVERILAAIGNETAAIGLTEVKEDSANSACGEIAVLETMLSEKRNETEEILELAEQSGAKIIFVNPKSEAGKKLFGLGGIAGVLRYRRKW